MDLLPTTCIFVFDSQLLRKWLGIKHKKQFFGINEVPSILKTLLFEILSATIYVHHRTVRMLRCSGAVRPRQQLS